MLSSITPLGERGRHNRFAVTATAFVIGAIAGGVALGALAGFVGSALPSRAAPVDALLVALLALAGAWFDIRRVPTIKRQVNEDWLGRYRGWVYGFGFGAQLGFGLVTVVTSAATYVAFVLALLSGSSAAGALIGFTFGAIRGLSLLMARHIDTPEALRAFHRTLDARAPRGAQLAVAAQGLLGVIALVALGGRSMSALSGSGITIDVPGGWDGRIYTRAPEPSGLRPATAGVPTQETTGAVVHVASFPLPAETGDYGGGAVEIMASTDLLLVLFEHGHASANTPLFAATSIPRLQATDVSTMQLQRLIDGQGGVQRFFTVAGRAFCLYVVFGSYIRRVRTIPVVNEILDTIAIN